jgi:TRAP-type mannitol/chloroaromatic compound transport system permease large subunit
VKTSDIHKGALPFMALQTVGLIIVMVFPETVTWLVDVFFADEPPLQAMTTLRL